LLREKNGGEWELMMLGVYISWPRGGLAWDERAAARALGEDSRKRGILLYLVIPCSNACLSTVYIGC
jgi:hypothetical protein